MVSVRATSVVAAALALVPAWALAQHDHAHEEPATFGQIHFPTSCKPQVQPTFELAVAMLHSFAYTKAAKTFEEVSAKDPGCGLAQWGVAMTYLHIIWAPPTDDEFAAGRAAAQKAAAIGAPTPRERDYIAAINTYYQGDGIAHPARVVAYEKAMAGVAQRSPADDEAQIFHALSILGVAYNSPPDKTYAKIAPAAPHALHMPSHIFTRLGMWNESIESNLASQRTAQAWLAKTNPGATAFDGLHAMDYLEYAYLQTGQDAKAQAVADDAAKVSSLDIPQFAAAYALAAIPARHALERRAWKEAAAVKLATSIPWAKYPYAEAIVHYARSVGSARTGDLETARQELATLGAIQTGLKGQKGFDWATQVEIQRRAAAAWLARAEKKDAEALELMRSAADLEDSTDKHPVTPGSILPAREQLADLLAETGQAEAALAQYEESLRSAPARFNSYSGAARAAERAGKKEKAKAFRERLAALCGGSVPARAQITAADPAREVHVMQKD